MSTVLLALAALTLSGSTVMPQATPTSPREQLVVSVAWLREHAGDPALVLLHVGSKATYDAGHIPGARYVDYANTLAVSTPGGLTLELLPPDLLRERLAALGISDTSRIVVYQSDDMWAPSTRVMLTPKCSLRCWRAMSASIRSPSGTIGAAR